MQQWRVYTYVLAMQVDAKLSLTIHNNLHPAAKAFSASIEQSLQAYSQCIDWQALEAITLMAGQSMVKISAYQIQLQAEHIVLDGVVNLQGLTSLIG